MKQTKLRNAFSLVTAIFLIVLMAIVAIYVMNLSGKIVKSSVAQYQQEQAKLYAKSYTDYAILAVTGNDRATACLGTITGTIGSPTIGNGYNVRTNIAYIANGTTEVDLSSCSTILSSTVQTEKSPLTIIVDVYVDYKDPDNTGGPWFTVHRRSVQKI